MKYRLCICIALLLACCRSDTADFNPAEALQQFDRAQHLSLKERFLWLDSLETRILQRGSDDDLANLLRRKGNLYMESGALRQAVDAQQQSFAISAAAGDSFSCFSTSINLGSIYQYFGLYDSAFMRYAAAYRYFSANAKPLSAANAAFNASGAAALLNRNTDAQQYARMALRWKRSVPDSMRSYKADSLAFLLQLLDLSRSAAPDTLDHLLEQTKTWVNREAPGTLRIMGAAKLAGFLAPTGDSRWFQMARSGMDSVTDPGNRRILLNDLAVAAEALNEPALALKYHRDAAAISDTLYNADKLRAVLNATETFRMLSQAERQALKATNSRNNWIIMAAALLLAALATGIFLLHRQYRQRQRIQEQEIILKNQTIDKLIQDQELSQVNAALEGQQAERQRIAQELHDRLGSVLAVAKLHFYQVDEEVRKIQEVNRRQFEQVSLLLDEAVDEVRRISHDLYAGSVVKFGLQTAITQLAQAITGTGKCRVHFLINGLLPDLDDRKAIDIYRCIQELISNSLKHSGATDIHIQLIYNNHILSLSYEDNGVGYQPGTSDQKDGLGMQTIRNRMERCGMNWHIETSPGRGFAFFAELPNMGDV